MKGKISSLKASCLILAIVLTFVFSTQVFAGKPVPGPTISFGITAPKTKVADSGNSGSFPTYGPGKSMVINGNEVYVAFANYIAWDNVEIRVCSSIDGGLTWGKSVVIAKGVFNINGAAIALGPNPYDPGHNLLHVIWSGYASNAGAIFYSQGIVTSTDTPTSWSAPVIVNTSVPEAGGYSRSIAADSLGNVHIAYQGSSGIYGTGVFYIASGDGGITFDPEIPVALGLSDIEPNIAVDNAGNVFVAWRGLGFSKKPAGSSSFSSPIYVNGGLSASWCSLAVFDTNKICISTSYGNTVYVSCTTNGGNSGSDWRQYIVTTGVSANRTNLAFDASGKLNVIWEAVEGASTLIYFSRSTNGGSTWTTPVRVGDNARIMQDPKIAIDAAGKACIVYPTPSGEVVYFTKEK